MECTFCKIANQNNREGTIFEDDRVFVMLDIDWAAKGHTLVIWKTHADNMSDLSIDDFSHFSEIVRKTEKALLSETQSDKSVVLKSGGLISHFHFHIYPVKADTPWGTILDMFEKKVRYKPKEGEKEELLVSLRKHFSTQ